MPPFHAARVEKKIVKIPEDEIVVTLGRSEPTIGGSSGFKKDLRSNQ